MRTTREKTREIPVHGEFDIIVCGGGLGGTATTIAAARAGRGGVVETKSGREAIRARVVVDATGGAERIAATGGGAWIGSGLPLTVRGVDNPGDLASGPVQHDLSH